MAVEHSSDKSSDIQIRQTCALSADCPADWKTLLSLCYLHSLQTDRLALGLAELRQADHGHSLLLLQVALVGRPGVHGGGRPGLLSHVHWRGVALRRGRGRIGEPRVTDTKEGRSLEVGKGVSQS